MINEVIVNRCDECNGVGLVFWGDNMDYDVEACACVDKENN